LEVYEEMVLEIGFMRPNIIIKLYNVMCQFNGIYDYVRYVHDKSSRQRVSSEGNIMSKAFPVERPKARRGKA
jgi:hypothetical protein